MAYMGMIEENPEKQRQDLDAKIRELRTEMDHRLSQLEAFFQLGERISLLEQTRMKDRRRR